MPRANNSLLGDLLRQVISSVITNRTAAGGRPRPVLPIRLIGELRLTVGIIALIAVLGFGVPDALLLPAIALAGVPALLALTALRLGLLSERVAGPRPSWLQLALRYGITGSLLAAAFVNIAALALTPIFIWASLGRMAPGTHRLLWRVVKEREAKREAAKQHSEHA